MTDPIAILRSHTRPLEPIPTGVEPVCDPLPEIRAVLFDIYGTLFLSAAGGIEAGDTTDEIQALQDAARLTGLSLSIDGQPALDLLRRLVRTHQDRRRAGGIEWPEVEIREVWQDWLQSAVDVRSRHAEDDDGDLATNLCLHFESLAHPVWPAPGAREAVARLAERGLTLGLVSNAQFYTSHLFPAFFGADSASLGFREAVTIYSHRLREAKPSRRLYDAAAAALQPLGISPRETLMIGNDLRNDIAPAAATGFRTALYAGDARSLRLHEGTAERPAIEPERILTDWSQLSSILPFG